MKASLHWEKATEHFFLFIPSEASAKSHDYGKKCRWEEWELLSRGSLHTDTKGGGFPPLKSYSQQWGYVLQCHMQKTRIKTLPDMAYTYPFPPKLSSSIFVFVDTYATRKQLSPLPPFKSQVQVMTPSSLRTRAAYQIRDRSCWAPKRKRTAAPSQPRGVVGANA